MSDISDKVDVGFVKTDPLKVSTVDNDTPETKEVLYQVNNFDMRLEALKLAYEVAYKQNIFTPHWEDKEREDQIYEYEQIFKLAELNYQFIISGKSIIE